MTAQRTAPTPPDAPLAVDCRFCTHRLCVGCELPDEAEIEQSNRRAAEHRLLVGWPFDRLEGSGL